VFHGRLSSQIPREIRSTLVAKNCKARARQQKSTLYYNPDHRQSVDRIWLPSRDGYFSLRDRRQIFTAQGQCFPKSVQRVPSINIRSHR
jgi:hypothetical protein